MMPDDRKRAYELYLSSGIAGQRKSLRAIAQELGVHLSSIARWKAADRWEERLDQALTEVIREAVARAGPIKDSLAQAVREGIASLQKILAQGEHKDKVLAFRELVNTAVKFQLLDLNPAQPTAEFKDDMEWQRETTSPEDSESPPTGPDPEPSETTTPPS